MQASHCLSNAQVSNFAAQEFVGVHQVLSMLAKAAKDALGVSFVSISSFDPDSWESERLFSTHPHLYPVSGRKPMNETDWSRLVMVEKRVFIANNAHEIEAAFFDHREISKFGYESVINIPIVIANRVCGTINAMANENHFNSLDITAVNNLKLLGQIVFLIISHNENR